MFKNKIVIVTGGANGIGREIALSFGRENALVIISDIDDDNGKKVAEAINGIFYQCDIRNSIEVEEFFKWIKSTYTHCDILINNAGISVFKNVFDISIEEFDDVVNVNLRGAFLMSQGFVKLNRNTKYGRIINISSTRFLMSEPNSEAYASSKGGIVALTHALALSLSNENITVNCISPGWIETKVYDNLKLSDHMQHPSKRVGKPSDIARICLFLCQIENDFINGENIIVDGGMTKKMIYLE